MHRGVRLMAAATLATFVAASAAFAQGAGLGGFRGRGPGGRVGVELPLRQLELTDAQREQIRQLMERHRTEIEGEITALLTPDQQQRLQALKAERQKRMQERRRRLLQRLQQSQPPRPPA